MAGLSGLPEQQLRPAYRQALLRELMRRVADAPRLARRRRRQRRALTSVIAALITGTGGAVAYSTITAQRPVTDHHVVRCYTIATYRPGSDFPGTSTTQATLNGSPGSVSAAIATCAALWQIGELQLGVAQAQPNPPRIQYVVPPLVECVLPDGRAAVFPGPTQCQTLGLQQPVPTPGG